MNSILNLWQVVLQLPPLYQPLFNALYVNLFLQCHLEEVPKGNCPFPGADGEKLRLFPALWSPWVPSLSLKDSCHRNPEYLHRNQLEAAPGWPVPRESPS